MKPKFIAMNVALAACVMLLAWQARVRWEAAQDNRRANLNVAVRPVPPPPLSPAQKPEAVTPAKYADVADKNVFAKDRNATVIVDPPKVEAAKPMPPLPVVYGVLGLPSGTKALMAEKAGGASRPIHTGDTVGEFTVLALDTRDVTFEWEGKRIERRLDDLIDRTGVATSSGPATSGPAVTAAPAPAALPAGPPSPQNLGVEIGVPGDSTRACKPGDNTPSGSVVEDSGVKYTKTVTVNPFGPVCKWVQSK